MRIQGDEAGCRGPPFRVSLQDYEDFLAGWPTTERWVASTRVFPRNARPFLLIKEGVEHTDSRRADGLAYEIHAKLGERSGDRGRRGGGLLVDALVTNSGTTTWRGAPLRRVVASCQFNVHVEPVDPPRTIAPDPVSGELPPLGAGCYITELDYVAARVSWFAPLGSHPARVAVEVVTH